MNEMLFMPQGHRRRLVSPRLPRREVPARSPGLYERHAVPAGPLPAAETAEEKALPSVQGFAGLSERP